MKIKRILLMLLPLITIVLEALPMGVVLNFGNPNSRLWIRFYHRRPMLNSYLQKNFHTLAQLAKKLAAAKR